jgi:DNA replicative helicase MCM subunit Mcm2 (Cdc46/Mcm family)
MATAHLVDGTIIKYTITFKKLMKALYNTDYCGDKMTWDAIDYKDQFLPATAKILNIDINKIDRAYL